MHPYFQIPWGIFLCNSLSKVITVWESEAEKKIACGAMNILMLTWFSNPDSMPKVFDRYKNTFFDRFLGGCKSIGLRFFIKFICLTKT